MNPECTLSLGELRYFIFAEVFIQNVVEEFQVDAVISGWQPGLDQ